MGLYYIAFILNNNLYNNSRHKFQDVSNEILILISIYVLMLFCEQYIAGLDTRDTVGLL